MSPHTRRLAALVGAAALLVPSAAAAHGGGHGKPEKQHATGKSKPSKPTKPAKRAAYVFKGVWHADGTVTVTGGNARVRKGHFVGEVVTFDLAGAKLRAADTNGSGAVDAADLVEGDKVVVQARLPRTEPGEGPFAARKLVDQTHPAIAEGNDDDEPTSASPAPTAD